jgi:NAD(P)-dependent dehydrogenase (short-subunit alcohol dehydrogenase family)
MADRAGKTYVVSGGASGLGEATCRALIAQGANVGVLDRDEDKGKQLAAELGPRAAFYFMDATKEETIKKAVDACKDKFGGIHGAVACAGVGAATTTLGKGGKPHDSGVWDFVIKVNLYGVFNLAKYAASHVSVLTTLVALLCSALSRARR